MKTIALDPRKSIRSQIAEYFRAEIRNGGLKTGDRLPSARELAGRFGTAEANVHHALATLVKEGMLIRRPKAGTIVTDGVEKLRCAAIYLNWYSIQRGENFTRLLIEMLEKRLARSAIRCMVIYDTPSQNGLKELKLLAERRQVQGVIVRSLPPELHLFFARLPVPFSAVSSMRIPNRVSFFSPESIRCIMKRIRADGVGKLGILSSANLDLHRKGTSENALQPGFLAALREQKLEVRPEWIFDSGASAGSKILDSSLFACHAFEKIWALSERPEAILAFSDDLVSGLTMAFYHLGVRVPEDLRLYVHKTRENELILPFPCTLLENRISELADRLVRQLIDQSEGRTPEPASLSCTFREWPA